MNNKQLYFISLSILSIFNSYEIRAQGSVKFENLNETPTDPAKSKKPESVTMDFPAFLAYISKKGNSSTVGDLSDMVNYLIKENNLDITFKFGQQDKELIEYEFGAGALYIWERLYLDFKNALVASEGKDYLKPLGLSNWEDRNKGITDFKGPDHLYVDDNTREKFDKKIPEDLKIPNTFLNNPFIKKK